MIVGEIINISARDEALNDKGELDISRIKPIALDPVANSYVSMGPKVEQAFNCGEVFKE